MANATRDDNRVVALIAEDSDGNRIPVPLVADPVTGRLLVNTTGTVTPIGSLVNVNYDYVAQTQNDTQDIWTFKTGGTGGTTVATVTITYVDATKAIISTVART